MTGADFELLERRVLALAPTGRDADLTRSILDRADVACHQCADLTNLCEEMDRGAGAVLIVEETLFAGNDECLAEWIRKQPSWSDLPILLMARPMADSAVVGQSMALLGNVTVLERPIELRPW